MFPAIAANVYLWLSQYVEACTYRALAEILLGLLERHLEFCGVVKAELPIKS